jgi:hypothetical protein
MAALRILRQIGDNVPKPGATIASKKRRKNSDCNYVKPEAATESNMLTRKRQKASGGTSGASLAVKLESRSSSPPIKTEGLTPAPFPQVDGEDLAQSQRDLGTTSSFAPHGIRVVA